MKSKCLECKYHQCSNGQENHLVCMYIEITGHRRNAHRDRENGCEKFELRTEKKKFKIESFGKKEREYSDEERATIKKNRELERLKGRSMRGTNGQLCE